MNIVLTGFMASGKTEISKAVAAISKYTLADTDELIEKEMNMTINEIFDKYGEEYFRKIEKAVIKKAAENDNTIISTGGGVVLDASNIDILRRTGIIINLAPPFSVIRERLEAARATRPLLKNDSIENIEKRFNDRKPFYDNCDYKIKVISGRTPQSYALEILKIAQQSGEEK